MRLTDRFTDHLNRLLKALTDGAKLPGGEDQPAVLLAFLGLYWSEMVAVEGWDPRDVADRRKLIDAVKASMAEIEAEDGDGEVVH